MNGLQYFHITDLYGTKSKNIFIKNLANLNAIIGNNGCGKTTILKLITYSLKFDIYELFNYNFKEIEYSLNDIIIKIFFKETSKNKKIIINFNNKEEISFNKDSIKVDEKIDIFNINFIEFDDDFNLSKNPNKEKSTFKRRNIDSFEKIKRLKQEYLQFINVFYIPITRTYNFINSELEDFTLKHIEDIIRNENKKTMMIQDKINEELKKEMLIMPFKIENNGKLQDKIESIKKFSSQEKTKLIESYQKLGIDNKNIRKFLKPFLEELEKTREFVIENNIKTEMEVIKKIINEKYALNIFSDKLGFCFELINKINDNEKMISKERNKINLLEQTINNFLKENFKHFKIMANGDIEIKNDITNAIIELKNISSGEKQLITLFTIFILKEVNLLKNSQDNSINIFLIDEPELSLHIDWQREFCQELISINEKIQEKNQYILATHSPSILLGPINQIYKLGEIDYGE